MDYSERAIIEQIAFLSIVIIFSMPDCYIYPSHLFATLLIKNRKAACINFRRPLSKERVK